MVHIRLDTEKQKKYFIFACLRLKRPKGNSSEDILNTVYSKGALFHVRVLSIEMEASDILQNQVFSTVNS